AGRIVGARNFTTGGEPDADVTDEEGHGTHVAGIAAAAGNNGQGVAGVAWGVKVMPVKVLGGQAGMYDVLDGLLYAVRYAPGDGTRVRVVNMSLGIPSAAASGFFAQALAEAREAGVLVVGAAGNDGREGPNMPSSTPLCLAVGATGHYMGWESLTAFSNYGDRLDLVAPGEDVLSTLPTGGSLMGAEYGLAGGTSMAAPYVAGVAALLAAKYDGAHTAADATYTDAARARLLSAVDDLGAPGRDPVHGAGRLNARKALTPATLN
ncbi:MAG: S8 family serine peptidase, partial [Candidatus Sericytochromatia bacterium]